MLAALEAGRHLLLQIAKEHTLACSAASNQKAAALGREKLRQTFSAAVESQRLRHFIRSGKNGLWDVRLGQFGAARFHHKLAKQIATRPASIEDSLVHQRELREHTAVDGCSRQEKRGESGVNVK